MKITCQSCQSKYTVSDEKVQGKTVKIKCRKCGATILVNSSGATTTNADAASAAGAEEAATDGGSYQINVAEGDQRTMSLQEIVQAYNSSVITADTYVWADGMGDWQPLGQVQAIVDALNAAAQGASAPQPAPEPARAAVKKDGARGGARDLFGSDGASDVSTSASGIGGSSPRAAAAPVRIGAGKEEQSALFSLSALTNRAGQSASAASSLSSLGALASTPSKSTNSDDSGLIDLKALAAGAASPPAASAAASLLGDSGGLFELAAPPVTAPAAAPIPIPEDTKPQKNRTPLFIGLGALVAVGAIVGAFMVMKGGEPPAEQTTAQSAAPANTPPPLETAPPVPTPSVAETEAPAASASAVAKGGGTTKTGGGTTKTGGGATTKAGTAPTTGGGTAPASTAKTAPKPSSCGCAPGDLMCAMRCSAKGK
ncbi:zinc-ribbon domain-containing protein [Polyangium jinanense]|uniref:Zinc-ribbon domain-containing protein n=1 Tax=Polyangium jinanense TaxID=2829994 RepID=A0A9X4ATP1_9BACT|nr:zinc-ribbon domain-containing protein [Polyangium jinanense]MDC3960126.1 zinc-ribbon domain-containing protein [Polyangium jinanense]MDC3984443.1 zinc-ribbon domain-containing protein [Polyangium jinanense]